MTMAALTVLEPWATMIADGTKFIETRAWKTTHRGPLAIHAGMGTDHIEKARYFGYDPIDLDPTLGHVLAVTMLSEIMPTELARALYPEQVRYGDFTDGRWAWMLLDTVKLSVPLKARGKPGMWVLSPTMVISNGRA